MSWEALWVTAQQGLRVDLDDAKPTQQRAAGEGGSGTGQSLTLLDAVQRPNHGVSVALRVLLDACLAARNGGCQVLPYKGARCTDRCFDHLQATHRWLCAWTHTCGAFEQPHTNCCRMWIVLGGSGDQRGRINAIRQCSSALDLYAIPSTNHTGTAGRHVLLVLFVTWPSTQHCSAGRAGSTAGPGGV